MAMRFGLRAVAASFFLAMTSGHVAAAAEKPAGAGGWWVIAAAIWLLPVAVAMVLLVRERSRDLAFMFAFLAAGLGLPALASALLQPMSLPGRHDFFLVPLAALLVAVGLRRLPAIPRHAYLAVLLGLGAWAGIEYARQAPARDEREWAEAVARGAAPGDVVLCTGLTRPSAEYYIARTHLRFASYPRQMEQDLAHLDDDYYLSSVDLPADARAVLDEAAAHLAPGGRLWVIASPLARSTARSSRRCRAIRSSRPSRR
jgi:hypothetical protein